MKPETIRSWYRRTTRAALFALLIATIVSIVGSIVVFIAVHQDVITKIQTFNGALTVPVFGGLWIASFIILWLNPSREVMFRSQESMERMEASFEERLKRVDVIIAYFEKAVESDILGTIKSDMERIRIRIEKQTETLPIVPRRPLDPPPFMPAHELVPPPHGNGD